MKIACIGATRGIGKQVLFQALSKKYFVTALARHPAKIAVHKEYLRALTGDFLDYDSVEEAVRDVQAVVVSVGAMPSRKPVSLFSEGTKNLLKALDKNASHALIVAVTGIGAGDSKGHGGFFYNNLFNPLLLKTIYEDKNRQEELLRKEYDNWIIVRPGLLTNGKNKGTYRAITDLRGIHGGKIARADVAHFILQQIEKPTFIKQTPLLIY